MITSREKKKSLDGILIAVSGLNPQIITETLYCLTQTVKPETSISEIYAVTTRAGKEKILKTLLSPKDGKFYSFCKEYKIDPDKIKFNRDTIISICDKDGNELDDIRTKEDNASLANTILSFIKDKTSEKDTVIHCSVAGGRKTMSLYLGCALQFYGRQHDTMSHVLVSPPEFERASDFFYKPKNDVIVKIRNEQGRVTKRLNTKDAVIELAEIPYIHLRDKVSGINIPDYDEIVNKLQAEIDSMPTIRNLVCSIKKRTLSINGKEINLQPLELVIYLYHLNNKKFDCKQPERVSCSGCTGCFKSLGTTAKSTGKLLHTYKEIYGEHSAYYSNLQVKWHRGISPPYEPLIQYISKINRKISQQLDDSIYSNYTISSTGKYGDKLYGIKLDSSKIEIVKN
ncbi:MAG: CRISPR-associated ring nuclease Csm6 [Candidatus Scalindua sp.]